MKEKKLKSIVLSVLVHLAILSLFVFSVNWFASSRNAASDGEVEPIQATVVDADEIEAEARKLREAEEQRQRQIEAERRRLAELEQQRQAAEKAAEERRKQEAAEQARQAELERRRLEEEAKKKAEAERQAREEAERKAREEAERKRREQEAREQAEREAQLRTAMEAEQRRLAAERAGVLDQYKASIRQKVERNWIPPASVQPGLECTVRVTQIPGGEVVNVQVTKCNGDAPVVRSIETAVLKASPLPPPPPGAEFLFDRQIEFIFKPQQ